MYTIDVWRPTVAWHLNCTAARICLTAGFHRKEQLSRDPSSSKVKSSLFWYVYTIDRALGLRLGRAPVIRGWDIDIPGSFDFEGVLSREMSGMAMMWVKLATLQGSIYEKLSVSPTIISYHALANDLIAIVQTHWLNLSLS